MQPASRPSEDGPKARKGRPSPLELEVELVWAAARKPSKCTHLDCIPPLVALGQAQVLFLSYPIDLSINLFVHLRPPWSGGCACLYLTTVSMHLVLHLQSNHDSPESEYLQDVYPVL